nr:hypothetical protein [Nonomuraea wenchangensis]
MDHGRRDEAAADVQHVAADRIVRPVLGDAHGGAAVLAEDLQQAAGAVEEPGRGGRLDEDPFWRDLQPVALGAAPGLREGEHDVPARVAVRDAQLGGEPPGLLRGVPRDHPGAAAEPELAGPARPLLQGGDHHGTPVHAGHSVTR